MAGNCYSIHKNRLTESVFLGFELSEQGVLETIPGQEEHFWYCKAIDSGMEDSTWGRMRFDLLLEEDMACFVYVTAMNEAYFYRNGLPKKIESFLCDEKESNDIKKNFMKQVNAKRIVNEENILLYDLKGRYLYFFIEVIGTGNAAIKNIRIEQTGDTFMNTFPDIYQERNSFFHRYMSIFSTIYHEFEDRIDRLPDLLDPKLCPSELLPVYASWMGVEVKDDFFSEEILRELVKNISFLNRYKGTKVGLQRIIEICLGEKPRILERNIVEEHIHSAGINEFERLYGKSRFDVTILIEQELTEIRKNQLMFLLNQYKPVRTRLHIVTLKKTGTLDSYSYLDTNARIPGKETAKLDEKTTMDGIMILQ